VQKKNRSRAKGFGITYICEEEEELWENEFVKKFGDIEKIKKRKIWEYILKERSENFI